MKVLEEVDPMKPKSQTGKPTLWEYQSVRGPNTLNLAKYGDQGWELVSVLPLYGELAVFYFRRRK
jgi:hypothetical protein